MENALNIEQEFYKLKEEFETFKKVDLLRDYYTHGGYQVIKPCLLKHFEAAENTMLNLSCPCPRCTGE